MRPKRALKQAKKKEKKKEKKLRDVTSHIFAQTTHVELPPTKVIMWDGVPNVVNYTKLHRNWFRDFGSPRSRNLPFSYA